MRSTRNTITNREVLDVNAQAVIQKSDEAWRSFFKLLDLRKKGRLPPHIKKISPPVPYAEKNTKTGGYTVDYTFARKQGRRSM